MNLLYILLAGLGISTFSQAQVIHHMDVFVQDQFNQNITINNGDTIISIEALKEPQMFVVLADSNNISAFYVKIGSSPGGSDIIEKTFTYGDEGTFQDGTSYTRDGLYVRFNLGQYASLGTYYASIRATVNGSQQSAITFNN